MFSLLHLTARTFPIRQWGSPSSTPACLRSNNRRICARPRSGIPIQVGAFWPSPCRFPCQPLPSLWAGPCPWGFGSGRSVDSTACLPPWQVGMHPFPCPSRLALRTALTSTPRSQRQLPRPSPKVSMRPGWRTNRLPSAFPQSGLVRPSPMPAWAVAAAAARAATWPSRTAPPWSPWGRWGSPGSSPQQPGRAPAPGPGRQGANEAAGAWA
mmetsp:Transcript_28668/g.43366  ORF Transcript_28668/g.43366 Transcript_28668/m.43366 type:complete len:211 (+) Transcript_28668:46-678(+)